MQTGPEEDTPGAGARWQVRVLESPPPHVREFLTETEDRFLAGSEYMNPDNGNAGNGASPGRHGGMLLEPGPATDHPRVSPPASTHHETSTHQQDRAAAGTSGIDPRTHAAPRRRHISRGQRIGGLLLMAACIAAAVWYVPRVVASDQRSLTGTVTSTGVIDLNFAKNGQLSRINVHLGQQVTKGETLATESDPATQAVVNADKAAIGADNAKLAELRTQPGASQQALTAVANAQLQKDQAQLATDQASLTGTRIAAAQAGTVVAVNGQPGEMVSTLGIRDYSSDSGTTAVGVTPQFSLLPEGPQSRIRSTASQSELPVIALRISDSWEVVILVPENSVSTVRAGRPVTINVPSAGLQGVRGTIQEVLPTPQSTATGVAYQAVVKVLGHQANAPLSGMSADVELNS